MAYCASVVSAVSLTFITRPAQESDLVSVRHLLGRARRTFIIFGDEDLHGYVSNRDGSLSWLAERHGRLQGFLAVSTARPLWSEVRGLALAEMDGSLVRRLVETAQKGLSSIESLEGLICLASAQWLDSALVRAGFQLVDHVVNYRCSPVEHRLQIPEEPNALRPANGDDLEALLELDSIIFDPLWQMGRSHMLTYLLTTEHFMVIEQEDKIIGYAATTIYRKEGQVVRLAMHPTAQGKGWGRTLLTDALNFCASEGASVTALNTQASNQVSQRLYKSVGFRPDGQAIPVLTYRWA